jgi:hypothetical protein
MWFVIGRLNCPKVSLVSRLIDETNDICINSITHGVVTVHVYSSKLIPYVFFEIEICMLLGTLSALL